MAADRRTTTKLEVGEPVVHTDLRRVDVVEGMVEAKWSAREGGPGRGCYRAASLETTPVAEGDEHVLALKTPIGGECPLDAAADCPRGVGVAACSRDQPVAAPRSRILAHIEHRAPRWYEGGAALDVKQRAVPGVSQPAGHHGVPIAHPCASKHVKRGLCADNGRWIEGLTVQAQVADFALEAEDESRAGGLPIAAERAAANETGVEVSAPRMRRNEPRRNGAARIGLKRRNGDRAGRAETV